jgi:hypothetical protein
VTAPQLDGGVDESDRDQTEERLAAAVTALLAAKTAGAPWLALVQGSLSGLLTHFLQRSALDMATASGQPASQAATVASDAVNSLLGDIERHTASWLAVAAKDRAPAGGGPMGAEQAGESAGIVSRSLVTYARERVREEVARKLGAKFKTWTSRGDDRVRAEHRELAGQTRPLDDPFQVDGALIMRPGDPAAPPELCYGCRCHLRYTVEST